MSLCDGSTNLASKYFAHSVNLNLFGSERTISLLPLIFDKIKPFEVPNFSFKRDVKDIFSYKSDDFNIIDYRYHETIKAPIAV